MDSTDMRARSRILNAMSRAVRNGVLNKEDVSEQVSQILDAKAGWSPIQFPVGVKEDIKGILSAFRDPLWKSIDDSVVVLRYLHDKGVLERILAEARKHANPPLELEPKEDSRGLPAGNNLYSGQSPNPDTRNPPHVVRVEEASMWANAGIARN